jgi:DNA-binding NarL/FixJ family response regulator
MLTTKKIRILAVDDHPLLRDGIAAVINSEGDLQLVGDAANGREAIELFTRLRPDITLMDLQMPEMSGIDAIIAIRNKCPNARIIALTMHGGDALARRVFKAGAASYLLKEMLRKELVDTIRAVYAGHRKIPSEIATQLAEHCGEDALSERELDVLKRVAVGSSNKRIGAQLAITEATVKAHMKSILLKLDASDRTHAVTIAINRGFFLV